MDDGAGAVFDLDENGTLVFSGQQEGPGRTGCHLTVLRVPSGYGPRHLAFDHSGQLAYVLCELVPKLLVAIIDPASGEMSIIRELDTVDSKKTELSAPAAVKVHPSGRTVAVFDTGYPGSPDLSLVDRFSCRGKTPRVSHSHPTAAGSSSPIRIHTQLHIAALTFLQGYR